jgi:hypothetical protein
VPVLVDRIHRLTVPWLHCECHADSAGTVIVQAVLSTVLVGMAYILVVLSGSGMSQLHTADIRTVAGMDYTVQWDTECTQPVLAVTVPDQQGMVHMRWHQSHYSQCLADMLNMQTVQDLV